jgi:hypothetical protein
MLLFGALGVAVSINALWLQSDRHPAPLFHQAFLGAQRAVAVPKKLTESPETAPSAASPAGSSSASQDTEAALPPSRSAVLAHGEAGAPTPARPLPAKHAERDPLADLIEGAAPVPSALIKPVSTKPQLVEKVPRAPASANDAIGGLIEQSAKGR